jgi:hypothetical protein
VPGDRGRHAAAFNVVSPQPVRNADFTQALAKTLRCPALFPAPAFALRLALGEMADALLLSSQRVQSVQSMALGYRFLYPNLPDALRGGAVVTVDLLHNINVAVIDMILPLNGPRPASPACSAHPASSESVPS